MESIYVEVQEEYLKRVTQSTPMKALFELIWNALDADATEVKIEITPGTLTSIEKISISDNGNGISHKNAEKLFGSLGNSWKLSANKTVSGRSLHGQNGEGRFKAFTLGEHVCWESFSRENDETFYFSIKGQENNLKNFIPSQPIKKNGTGTTVTISEIKKDFKIFAKDGADEKIREQFALYLYQYPTISLLYDDIEINSADAIDNYKEYPISTVNKDGQKIGAVLTIVEWNHKVKRKLILCLPGNFPISEENTKIQARGFQFTSYLTSNHFQTLVEENIDRIATLDEVSNQLIEQAREKLKTHFKKRETEKSLGRIEEWIEEEIYPFEGEPTDLIEKNEREVFNIIALNLEDYSSEFEKSPQQSRKLIFELVKNAIETNPKTLPLIFQQVIDLPEEQQTELAHLLGKTSLTAIINAVRSVTDRLDFLKALHILIFDAQSKKQLLERSQLQRILAKNTWIFGEEFNLTNDDETLTTVLKKHLELLGKDRKDISPEPVYDEEGKIRVVDLMLSRRVPLPRGDEREHLVVELKRPSRKLNNEDLNQISKYAHAVAKDERFDKINARWTFVIISNEIDDYVASRANQKDKPPGLAEDLAGVQVQVWVKTWAQILQETEGRLEFFKNGLEYSANEEEALTYLKKMSQKYLPQTIIEKINQLD